MGRLPLAGDFRNAGDPNQLHPLAIDGCARCGVLQVRDLIDLSILFNERYSYASSTVPGLVRHFEEFARETALPPTEHETKLLLEIGCNDGIFLDQLRRVGYRVVGIDASENVAEMARQRGLEVHTGFFDPPWATRLLEKYGRFHVVTCSNVFAHNPDVNGLVQAVDLLLDPDAGEFWIEVHSAVALYEELQWDFFYHEHCYYWTLGALVECLKRHDFKLKRYKHTLMHGGAIRAAFSKSGEAVESVEKAFTRADWTRFRQRALRSRDIIRACVEALPVTYAYGASGRAVTLINWAGIASKLQFVVDGSPLRFGRVIPNTDVPIISEDAFFNLRNVSDWCLVTAHNYFPDIRRKVLDHFSNQSMKFIIPLPNVTIR